MSFRQLHVNFSSIRTRWPISLSPCTRRRDLGIKRQLYDRGGVREYWVVDPKGYDLTVYRRMPDGTFSKVARLSAADDATLTTPLLSGFTLSLAKLFA